MSNDVSDFKIKCSVGILTFNSGDNLEKCLKSLSDFDEIIVCDGGSADSTVEIAKSFGCIILKQEDKFKYKNNKISNFSGVRNQILDKASHDWFLVADSDEYLTEGVVKEISMIVSANDENEPKYFSMLRKYEVDGNVIDYAGTYPNFQPKFFNKKFATIFLGEVHEKVYPNKGVKTGYIMEPTIVPVTIDYRKLNDKFAYYLQIDRERSRDMKRSNLLKSIYVNLKGVLGRWFRVFRNRMLHSGNHMSLTFEYVSTVYSLRLAVLFFVALLKKQ